MRLAVALLTLLIQAAPPQSRTGVVAGRLLNTNGTPAAGIRVAAMAAPGEAIGVPTLVAFARTDSSGRYRIEGIDPGRYFITAGMIELPTYFPGVLSAPRATAISVTAGSAITGVDFSLTAPPSGEFRLGGRLIFPANQMRPASARVTASRANATPAPTSRPGTIFQALVGADGSFQFANLPPGSYELRLDFVSLPAPITALVIDQDVTGIEIAVPRMLRVSGKLNFPPNLPAPGNPRVILTNSAAARLESAVAPDGGFEFVGLLAGAYDLRVSLLPLGLPLPIVVSDQDIPGIEIPVPVIAQIATAVEVEGGAPGPRLAMSIASADSTNDSRGVSAAGSFSTLLAEGDYHISIGALPLGYLVKSIRAGSTQLVGGLFSVSGPEPQTILVTLGRRSTVKISGRITSRPLPNALALYGSTVNTDFEAAIQPDGSFEFPAVLPGTYTTNVFSLKTATLPSSIVVLNNDVTDLTITTPALKDLTGRVAVEGGSPAPVFALVFTSETGTAITAVLDGSSGGAFKVTLPDGKYRVTTTMTSLFVKALTYGSTDLLTEPLRLSAADSSEIQLTFAMAKP